MGVVATDGPLDLKGHTLVVPGSGGLGQLGELCVDALITTYGLRRVAVAQSRRVLPAVMASAWAPPQAEQAASCGVTTAVELYQNPSVSRLSVLQMRSCPAEGRRRRVAEEIWTWAKEVGISELFIVASCSSHVKVDADLSASTELRFVHIPSHGSVDVKRVLGLGGQALDVLPLGYGHAVAARAAYEARIAAAEEGSASVGLDPPSDGGDLAAAADYLRGGGIARPLLNLCASEAGADQIAALCIMGLTSESVTLKSVEDLATAVCLCAASRTGMADAPQFCVPPSWRIEAEASARRLLG